MRSGVGGLESRFASNKRKLKSTQVNREEKLVKIRSKTILGLALAAGAVVANWTPAQAHHSYAMFDFDRPYVVTGVVTRNVPDAFHYLMFVARLNSERTLVVRDANDELAIYVIEMDSAGAVNELGINPENFPAGTIISVGFHTLREGLGGTLSSYELWRCPEGVVPAEGETCATVEGGVRYGRNESELPPDEPPLP